MFKNPTTLAYIFGAISVVLVLQLITLFFLRKFGKNPKYVLSKENVGRLSIPIFLIFLAIAMRIEALHLKTGLESYSLILRKAGTLLFIFAFTWLLLRVLKIVKKKVIANYDLHQEDNYRARKVYTQFNILERVIILIIVVLALAAALMSFDSIREIGLSIFASAGIAGIILGLSAQKMIGSILAGIQIAIAQPIKIDDVVIVEGEWGRIEEIMLTYVVINIWDKRRLIVPTTYFIEKPFQNWTKTSSDILGTVFLYTDYNVSFDKLREELTKILENTPLWDGKVNVLQVTDSKVNTVEVRALMSAKDSPTAWDLRVHVRERLITFLQQNYPESLPHTRVYLKNSEV